MKLALASKTKALERACLKKLECLSKDIFWEPISYFGNVESLRRLPEAEGGEARRVLKIFPQVTNDYDIIVPREDSQGATSLLAGLGYKEKTLEDRVKIRILHSGTVGFKELSPYKAYTSSDGFPIDIFLGSVGAVEILENFWKDGIANKIYCSLQPGNITEGRIRQYLPVYILGRLSGELCYEECLRTSNEIYSRAFIDRKKSYPGKRGSVRNEGGVEIYTAPYYSFLESAYRERNNLLPETESKMIKKIHDPTMKVYCIEAFDVVKHAFDSNMPLAK
jgi:hypothetical protein